MKVKLLLGACLAALLLAGTAQAAEAQTFAQAELFQAGSLTGDYTRPGGLALMDAGEEALYTLLYAGMQNRETSIDISKLGVNCGSGGAEMLKTVYTRVVNDHPELFYVKTRWGYRCSADGTIETVAPTYDTTLPADAQAQFDAAVTQALAQVDAGMDDVEKALALHDYLAVHCGYNWAVAAGNPEEAPDTVYSAYGALVEGDAVCQGYALAYRLLLEEAGIPSAMLTSANHMWNLVQLGGDWYHVDVTWDDPAPDTPGIVSHQYFLISDARLNGLDTGASHIWNEELQARTSTKYEDGWAFNGSWYPLYRWSGAYYYVKFGSNPYEYALYRTDDLSQIGISIVGQLANGYDSRFGALWLNGFLYDTTAAGAERILWRCSLDDGSRAEVGRIPFTETASEDGAYPADRDGVGLRYAAETGEVEAISRTRPTAVLGAFRQRDYPAAWDQVSTETVEIAGLQAMPEGYRVGVAWGEAAPAAAQELWEIFYKEGRLVGLRRSALRHEESGLEIIALETAGLPDWDQRKLVVLDEASWSPACEAWVLDETASR